MQGNPISFGDNSPVNKTGGNNNASGNNPQNVYVQKLLQNKLSELRQQQKAMRSEPQQNDSKKIAQSFLDKKIEDINRLLNFQDARNTNEIK